MALLSHWWISTEKKKLTQTKEIEKIGSRGNSKQRTKPAGKRKAVAFRRFTQSSHKQTKRTASALQKFSNDGAEIHMNKHRAPFQRKRSPLSRIPNKALESDIQRF